MAAANKEPTEGARQDAKVGAEKKADVRVVEDQGGRGPGLVAARAFKSGEMVVRFSNNFVPAGKAAALTAEDIKYRFDLKNGQGSYYYDASELGHFVNDAVRANLIASLLTCTSIADCEVWGSVYEGFFKHEAKQEQKGKGGFNLVPHEPHGPGKGLAWHALRDIREGEDLFTSYGVDYWIGQVALNTKASALTRMACTAWALHKGVYPTAGYVNSMPAVLFPVSIEDEKGVTTTVMAAMNVKGTDEAKARAAATGKAGEELCTRWLKLLGLDELCGSGVQGWREACDQVGLEPLLMAKQRQPAPPRPVVRAAPRSEEGIKPHEATC